IPFRFVWVPLAYIQEGLGGKAKVITASVIAGLVFLSAVFYFVPYPLKMDATGRLQPVVWRNVYPPTTGFIQKFEVQPNDLVEPGRDLALMYDPKLAEELNNLEMDIAKSTAKIQGLRSALLSKNASAADKAKLEAELGSEEAARIARGKQLKERK